jgi:hypothetical protein
MRQYKIGLLVVLVLAFATLLWMMNIMNPTKSSKGESVAVIERVSPPPPVMAAGMPARQTVVETAPLPLMAVKGPEEIAISQPLHLSSSAPNPAKAVTAASEPHDNVLPFIKFLSLPENYSIQGHEVAWREYREYRRHFARFPQVK